MSKLNVSSQGQNKIYHILNNRSKNRLCTKTFLLIDPAYSQDLYADEHFLFPGISKFDGDAIDFAKFPKLANVPYYEVTLHPGDMLYVPQYWWHIVRSRNSPNVAVNVWLDVFNFHDEFEKAGLDEDINIVKIVLRWAIHLNVTVIPRSNNPRNIALNFRALDLNLTNSEIATITDIVEYEYHPLERIEKGEGKTLREEYQKSTRSTRRARREHEEITSRIIREESTKRVRK
ncbi:JmjC domain-containing protein C [Exaiptasia diaphana]|nr:JmjC domain-containing protein C [Exaiptasia diaphana]